MNYEILQKNGMDLDEIIDNALKKISPGLQKYLNIREMIYRVNISRNEEFQKSFNGFYRMRQRPTIFYKKFYSFMEENKSNSPSFEEALLYIYQELGRVEASFSSKLVATINPNLPIWDTIVLKNIGLKPPQYYRKNRIKETMVLYNDLQQRYQTYIEKEQAKIIITKFNKAYPNTGLTDVKKIDFVLWQIR